MVKLNRQSLKVNASARLKTRGKSGIIPRLNSKKKPNIIHLQTQLENRSPDKSLNGDNYIDTSDEENELNKMGRSKHNKVFVDAESPSCDSIAELNDIIQPDIDEVNFSNVANGKKSRRRRHSGTSSEEERWLTAIESGKLEQVEDIELRKIKDPKLMTARQRAIYGRNNDDSNINFDPYIEDLLSLPVGYKEREKPQTTEEKQKAELKSQKRKQLADEKREKDKKKTVERLLNKQDSKQKSLNKVKSVKTTRSTIRYRQTIHKGAIIEMPPGVDFPLKIQTLKEPPKVILCTIIDCSRPKLYNCSKTNLPFCSYDCYRKNVLSLKEIMC